MIEDIKTKLELTEYKYWLYCEDGEPPYVETLPFYIPDGGTFMWDGKTFEVKNHDWYEEDDNTYILSLVCAMTTAPDYRTAFVREWKMGQLGI